MVSSIKLQFDVKALIESLSPVDFQKLFLEMKKMNKSSQIKSQKSNKGTGKGRRTVTKKRKKKKLPPNKISDSDSDSDDVVDIGEWSLPSKGDWNASIDLTAPDEYLLYNPTAAITMPSTVVADIVNRAGGPQKLPTECGVLESLSEMRSVLNIEQRTKLIAHIETELTKIDSTDAQRDFKLVIPETSLDM